MHAHADLCQKGDRAQLLQNAARTEFLHGAGVLGAQLGHGGADADRGHARPRPRRD